MMVFVGRGALCDALCWIMHVEAQCQREALICDSGPHHNCFWAAASNNAAVFGNESREEGALGSGSGVDGL